MVSFIEDHRDSFGVGPICRVLPIAPSSYYTRAAIVRNPELASDRAKSDVIDREGIKRIYKASGKRYGARKIWHWPAPPGQRYRPMHCGAPNESHGNTGCCAGREGYRDQS